MVHWPDYVNSNTRGAGTSVNNKTVSGSPGGLVSFEPGINTTPNRPKKNKTGRETRPTVPTTTTTMTPKTTTTTTPRTTTTTTTTTTRTTMTTTTPTTTRTTWKTTSTTTSKKTPMTTTTTTVKRPQTTAKLSNTSLSTIRPVSNKTRPASSKVVPAIVHTTSPTPLRSSWKTPPRFPPQRIRPFSMPRVFDATVAPQASDIYLIFSLGITVGVIVITIAGFCFFFFCVYKKELAKRQKYLERRAASGSAVPNIRQKTSRKSLRQKPPMRWFKRQYANPDLAPSYIEPENFVHKGHLVVEKYEEPASHHALEDQTHPTNDKNVQVTWQSKHEVVDFGEDVEEVISNRDHNKSKTRKSMMRSTTPGKSVLETGETQSLGLALDNVNKNGGGGTADSAKKLEERPMR